MSGKKTKLKKIELTSVDMVRRGANQEAYINLYKSAGDPPNETPPTNAPDAPNSDEIPQGLLKSIVEAVKGFLKAEEPPEPGQNDPDDKKSQEDIEKADTFKERLLQQEIRDDRWKFQDALNMSIDSILQDSTLSETEKLSMLDKSVDEFAEAYKDMCAKLLKATANTSNSAEPAKVGKSQDNDPDKKEEGEEEMKIDKSRFNAEELANYEALIAKGRVDEEPENDDDEGENLEKSAEMHPEVKKALAEMEELKKGMEMKEMSEVAKKYVTLGKKEDELASTLYEMKKSSPAAYDAYIAVLDQNLELVNKSGIFAEIGKSGSYGHASVAKSDPESRIEAIAKGYIEKDPTMDYDTAVMKAWENNPDLMAAYDELY